MSYIVCAAPVTRNIDNEMPTLDARRRRNCNAVWSCSLRVVCAVLLKLFIHFKRIRANTLGDGEQIKIIMSGAVRLSAVRIALYELFVHSERTRAVTQGASATCCIFVC